MLAESLRAAWLLLPELLWAGLLLAASLWEGWVAVSCEPSRSVE
ncbi:hypothetical protein AB0I81_46625 [Nonomuraea sp. NPDC050404]